MSVFAQFSMQVANPSRALVKLSDELARSDPEPLARAAGVFGDWWTPKRWEIKGETLLGPGGWSLKANKHTITITHVLRYGMIGSDNDFGPVVVDGVNYFGAFFGATSTIFSHEMLNVPDLPLIESVKELSKEFSQANSWDEARCAHFEGGCWLMVSLPIRSELI